MNELMIPAPQVDATLSERDRGIFERVVVEGRRLEEVADAEQLSVKQIRRIVQHVSRVLALRSLHQEAPWVRAMHLRRLEHQWQEVMLAWYRSQHAAVVKKVSKKSPTAEPSTERVSTQQSGDVRYLEYARKLLGEIRALGGVEDFTRGAETYATVETLTIEQRTAEFHRLVARLREQARSESLDRTGDGPVAERHNPSDAAPDALPALADGEATGVSRA
jgi:hypothetical protein